MLDEPVHLEPCRPDWDELFRVERARLVAGLGIPAAAIEHIGSTAVPGLSAKPIVDIMIGAPRVPPPAAWSEALVTLGYEALGEAGVPGRWYFRLRATPFRNAHIVEHGGAHWVKNLAFRNYLRRSTRSGP